MAYLLPLLLLAGMGYLLYKIPRKFGHKRAGTLLASLLGAGVGWMVLSIVFEDQLFFNRDALQLLKEQGISLNDDFAISNNESSWSIGDAYHTFTLRLSERDHNQVIRQMMSSSDFQKERLPTSLIEQNLNRYRGGKKTQNYETAQDYVRELFEPNGDGIVPTYRVVKVQKAATILVFEDIDE